MAKALAVVAAVWVTTVYWFSFLAVSTISRTGTSASSSSSSSISVVGAVAAAVVVEYWY
jgi:hypothetical protein